jgi:hypothetical protein
MLISYFSHVLEHFACHQQAQVCPQVRREFMEAKHFSSVAFGVNTTESLAQTTRKWRINCTGSIQPLECLENVLLGLNEVFVSSPTSCMVAFFVLQALPSAFSFSDLAKLDD